jgi:hypothetical protein
MLSGALVWPRGVLRAEMLASQSWRVADYVIQDHCARLVEARRHRTPQTGVAFFGDHYTWL